MSSPYTRTLTETAPPEPAPYSLPQTRPYTVPAYAAAPQYAPPRQVIMAPAGGSSKLDSVITGLLALIVVALAAVAGYYLATSNAPTEQEMVAYSAIAAQDGQYQGRMDGYAQGQAFGRQEMGRIAHLRARNNLYRNVYNPAYQRGMRDARRNWATRASRSSYRGGGGYYPTRSYGGGFDRTYYGRYTGGGYGGHSAAEINSAVAQAQAYANRTGSVVDVEIY